MSEQPQQSEIQPSQFEKLQKRLEVARALLAKPSIPSGLIAIWTGESRAVLRAIFGADSTVDRSWPHPRMGFPAERAREVLQKRMALLERLVQKTSAAAQRAISDFDGGRVFIGHGRSPLWREFKDFLQDRLGLQWDEFNRESVAGIMISERLSAMLDAASFAFLIMTAEDEHADATIHARENVVHEVGLFQGQLHAPRDYVGRRGLCDFFEYPWLDLHRLSAWPDFCVLRGGAPGAGARGDHALRYLIDWLFGSNSFATGYARH